MRFLLSEDVDRKPYDIALKSVEPLSEIEELVAKKMPNTLNAIRSVVKEINTAASETPSSFTIGTALDGSQRNLVNATTKAEILKFAMLNAMDGLRMLFISEFKQKVPKFFNDEALVFNVTRIGKSNKLNTSKPKAIPFSQISSMSNYEIVYDEFDIMVIMKESSAVGGKITLMSPSGPITIKNIAPGNLYIVGKNSDGDPSPVPPDQKSWWLGMSLPTKGSLDDKISALAASKGFDIKDVVTKNFKVPRQAEGMLTSIYRTIRFSKTIQVPYLTADQFANEIKDITLSDFKKIFEKIVEKTTGSKGDLSTQDFSDLVFFSGLASLSSTLGLSTAKDTSSTEAVPPASSGDSGMGTSSGSGGSGSSGGDTSSGARRHSIKSVLMHPEVVKGDTEAERAANLTVINPDGLRKVLNMLTGRNVVFTEGSVNRWCELAGIKEIKS
jgi:hypothetical protein